jgi:cytochrome P450
MSVHEPHCATGAAVPGSAGPPVIDPDALLADQLGLFDDLRGRCPIAVDGRLGVAILGHAEAVRVLDDPVTFSSAVSAQHAAVPNGFDPPMHTQYRELIDRYFTQERTAEFEPDCKTAAAELVAALPCDEPVEIMSRFALDFALRVQRRWLGWPLSTELSLREWVVRRHRAMVDSDPVVQGSIAEEFDYVIGAVLADRRSVSGPRRNDLTQELLEEQIDGRSLSDPELISILRNWTVGELATIAASVGIVIRYLAAHPDLQDRLRQHPAMIAMSIDEILRIVPPLISNRRITTRAVDVGGFTIPAHERVTVLWASANRDESVFGSDNHFDAAGHAADNLLYGRGIHNCPGACLARMELRTVTEELLARMAFIELAEDVPDPAPFPDGGYRSVSVRFTIGPVLAPPAAAMA